MTTLTIYPVAGIPELREGDDLAGMILDRTELEDRDVVVVAQKAVSKIEGRIVRLVERGVECGHVEVEAERQQ